MKVLSVTNGTKTLLIRSLFLVFALFIALSLRAYFAFMPVKMSDIRAYLIWSKRIAEIGINASYFGDFKKVIVQLLFRLRFRHLPITSFKFRTQIFYVELPIPLAIYLNEGFIIIYSPQIS